MPDTLPPYDGPHSAEATAQAAELAAAAIRYLANATRSPEALPAPGAVYDLLGTLQEIPAGFPQIGSQVASRLEAMAATGTLSDANGDDPATVARRAGRELEWAGQLAQDSAADIGAAQNAISGLYVKDESTEGEDDDG